MKKRELKRSQASSFPSLPSRPAFNQLEREILRRWDEEKTYERALALRKQKPIFSFYDGPPFATGEPHYGHLLVSAIKDTVLRYWSMRGYYVPRRFGWDCHGLPIENMIEKELGVRGKRELEQRFGIARFNSACRAAVFRYVKLWTRTLRRLGRWGDYEHAYATMDNSFIESVWWVFAQLWRQGLIYRDWRVTAYCPRCATPLSNFEAGMDYRDVRDPSIVVRLPLRERKKTELLVWTTTPWTLPANVAVAVDPQLSYVEALGQGKEERFILAESRVAEILGAGAKIVRRFRGRDLIGKAYEPLYRFVSRAERKEGKIWRVVPADFVSAEEGTGLVHIAPAFGEEDLALARRLKLPVLHTVDEFGCFRPEIKPWAGKPVQETNDKIIQNLKRRGRLWKAGTVKHAYPFCWRCETPLLYYATAAWYVAVTKFKRALIANNRKIRWVPAHLKHGRFGHWLAQARDWAISRTRFWGAPLPLWQCQACNRIYVVDSVKSLRRYAGPQANLKDLHRPYIDGVSWRCSCGKGKVKRVADVFDCWFESGSVPYAQWHYPFEHKQLVEKSFPADFIAEALDQTRGWFYTLHVLATALTLEDIGLGRAKPAFRNVIVNGLVLGADGRKLSKHLGNYTPPHRVFRRWGADNVRLYLLASTKMGEDLRFAESLVQNLSRRVTLRIWNAYRFLFTFAALAQCPLREVKSARDSLNRWMLARTRFFVREMRKNMDQFQVDTAARLIEPFVEDLTNWFIRRSREKAAAGRRETLNTLYTTLLLFAKAVAPFLPFLSDYFYRFFFRQSVHLEDYPRAGKVDTGLLSAMRRVQKAAAEALSLRMQAGVKVRQPLAELWVVGIRAELLPLLKAEVNVHRVKVISSAQLKKLPPGFRRGNGVALNVRVTETLRREGIAREVARFVQDLRKRAGLGRGEQVDVFYTGRGLPLRALREYKDSILAQVRGKRLLSPRQGSMLEEGKLETGGGNVWLGIRRAS
jgi:isoleucyl-tRNA synthetase